MKELRRCAWAESDPLLRAYHDAEWGVVERDGRTMWEALALEGFQAGLAWITILRKRDTFRRAFAGFEPAAVAKFGPGDVERLMNDPGIIRSRAKVLGAIGNAQAYLRMKADGEDFAAFAWAFVGGKPLHNDSGQVPAKSELSEEISATLKTRGFKFTGPVGVYAWMQAVGMVNDHAKECFRRKAVRVGR